VAVEESDLIKLTEKYVRETFSGNNGNLMIAHDFKHIHRVRNWAVLIAGKEKYPYREIVEITALLHDIGLVQMDDKAERKGHGPLGSEIATKYLKDNLNLSPGDIELIADTVRHHNDPPEIMDEHIRTLGNSGKLLEIISDADRIDALGAVGIMRAFTSYIFCRTTIQKI
jgi:uncharacterized protein